MLRCPVELSVGVLDQTGIQPLSIGAAGCRAETVKHRERAIRGDLEKRSDESGTAIKRCSVEAPVGALDESCIRLCAVHTAGLGAKTVKRRQDAAQRDFEDCTTPRNITVCGIDSATGGYSVQVPVVGLDQPTERRGAIRAIALGTKVVKRSPCATRGDFGYRPNVRYHTGRR